MAVRNIVRIDRDKCNGCGLCVRACVEGALALANGKAVLVKEEYCDGLGACLPICPAGAIVLEKREAAAFDARAVTARSRTAHSPGEEHCGANRAQTDHARCLSAAGQQWQVREGGELQGVGPSPSALAHWPVQLALVGPSASFLQGAEVVLCADCVPFAYADFHRDFLRGRVVLVACPKLDDLEAHAHRLAAIFKESRLKSLTILRMEVPCCAGLTRAAERAQHHSGSNVPLSEVIIGIHGEVHTDRA